MQALTSREYAQSASTVSRFDSATLGRVILSPSNTSAGSSATPLSATSRTVGAASSMKVVAPGSVAVNVTVVVEVKVS